MRWYIYSETVENGKDSRYSRRNSEQDEGYDDKECEDDGINVGEVQPAFGSLVDDLVRLPRRRTKQHDRKVQGVGTRQARVTGASFAHIR